MNKEYIGCMALMRFFDEMVYNAKVLYGVMIDVHHGDIIPHKYYKCENKIGVK